MISHIEMKDYLQNVFYKGDFIMEIARNTMTPFQILNAVKRLTEAEKETLAILADEKLSEELIKRRGDALAEMKSGRLISEEELFR